MKTYTEIYKELAGNTKFIWLGIAEQAAKIYSEQNCEDFKSRCADNAEGLRDCLMNTKIILP